MSQRGRDRLIIDLIATSSIFRAYNCIFFLQRTHHLDSLISGIVSETLKYGFLKCQRPTVDLSGTAAARDTLVHFAIDSEHIRPDGQDRVISPIITFSSVARSYYNKQQTAHGHL